VTDSNVSAGKYELSSGNGQLPEIVVEVGQAHEGSESFAHAHVDEVANAGADAIKFQLHIAAAESSTSDIFRGESRFRRESRYEYWKRNELSLETMQDLITHAKERSLKVGFSTFSLEGLNRVQESSADFLKIGSGEAIQMWFLEAAKIVDLPIVLSTGLSTLREVRAGVELLAPGRESLTLLQCTTRYPSRLEDVGLNVLTEFRELFGVGVGLSDHSGTLSPALSAIASGADMVEVHGTFTKKAQGLDSEASLTLDEISLLCQFRDEWSTIVSHPVDKDFMAENLLPMREVFGRSLAVRENLDPGHEICTGDLYFAKPGGGLHPNMMHSVLGKPLAKRVSANSLLKEEDFSQ